MMNILFTREKTGNYRIKMADMTWRIATDQVIEPYETGRPEDDISHMTLLVCFPTLWTKCFILVYIVRVFVMIFMSYLKKYQWNSERWHAIDKTPSMESTESISM